MHEFHLMRRIVHLVEDLAARQGGGRPVRIRLRVDRRSHFAEHTTRELQELFQIAAHGTIAQEAILAIGPMLEEDTCRHCGAVIPATSEGIACPACGTDQLLHGSEAEVLIQDIEWQDE